MKATQNPTRAGVSAALKSMSRPHGSFDAARYFRGDHGLRFYNVGTPVMRALARDIYMAKRAAWDVDDAMRFADSLMRDPYLETKSIAIEVVARYRRSFEPRLLARFSRARARPGDTRVSSADLQVCPDQANVASSAVGP